MESTHRPGIYDASGRYLAPLAVVLAERPLGPWNDNAAPRAVYAFEQDDFKGGSFAMFHIIGGESDKSTVSAFTLHALGIAVPQVAA
jgi:hypothetical protein